MKKTLKFVLMAIGLGVIGFAFAVLGALIGGRVLGKGADFMALGLVVIGLIVGYAVGIMVGIISLKKVLHQRGSVALGLIGSVIGAVLPLVLADPLRLNSNTDLLLIVFLISVPVFSLAGFLLKR